MSKTTVKTLTTEADVELAERRRYLLDKIEKNSPENILLTDEEIQEEVNMVRYENIKTSVYA
jgi:hypothetical protein